jgi:outer membrane biosynthesis protein TonB
MGVKYMAAWAASGILLISSGSALAGADESDAATQQQLKSSGTEMVPSETLVKPMAPPEPAPVQPIAQPEPQAPEPQPPAVEQPVAQPMPAPAPTTMPEPVAKSVSMSGPYLRVDIGYGLTNDPDGTQAGGNASESGETADNVAYALMAGGTVQNSDAIALDIGYRFISLGEIE